MEILIYNKNLPCVYRIREVDEKEITCKARAYEEVRKRLNISYSSAIQELNIVFNEKILPKYTKKKKIVDL